jgi:hypothetical protein
MKRTKSSRPTPPAPASFKVSTLDDKIREQAYYHWIDNGCPHGDDLNHWLAAEQQVLATTTAEQAESPAPHFSIRETIAAHDADPTHRFHAPSALHDSRLDVVSHEARQRVRARQAGGMNRSASK